MALIPPAGALVDALTLLHELVRQSLEHEGRGRRVALHETLRWARLTAPPLFWPAMLVGAASGAACTGLDSASLRLAAHHLPPLIATLLVLSRILPRAAAEDRQLSEAEAPVALEALGVDSTLVFALPRTLAILLSVPCVAALCGLAFTAAAPSVPLFGDPWVLATAVVQTMAGALVVAAPACHLRKADASESALACLLIAGLSATLSMP
ncbi:MAG: hypothetical protein AB7F75_02550 [Planctomycetota bacterium]